jgi:AcrR family transcriptional regulator
MTLFPQPMATDYSHVVFITVPPKSIASGAPRAYRSQLRQQQAEATRARVLAAAAKLFAADGYARTTLAKIADAAGVSAETVQGQGPKAALLMAAIDHAAFGVVGEKNVFKLEVGREFLAIEDYDQAVDYFVAAIAGVHAETAPLAPALFGGAAIDPELDRYLDDLMVSINVQSRRVLELYRERGWLRTDVPFDDLVETTVVIGSTETYLRITHRDGWSVDAYRSWCRRMLAETVFRARAPERK